MKYIDRQEDNTYSLFHIFTLGTRNLRIIFCLLENSVDSHQSIGRKTNPICLHGSFVKNCEQVNDNITQIILNRLYMKADMLINFLKKSYHSKCYDICVQYPNERQLCLANAQVYLELSRRTAHFCR